MVKQLVNIINGYIIVKYLLQVITCNVNYIALPILVISLICFIYNNREVLARYV